LSGLIGHGDEKHEQTKMAELINEDLLIKVLRYLHASQESCRGKNSLSVRESTLSVAITLLNKMGLVTRYGKISKKGVDFLTSNRLNNIFKCEVSPFGINYVHYDKNQTRSLLKILDKRPRPDYKLDHQPLMPELTMMRASYIASEENLYNKNVAFVGDYDSTNIALNLITKIDHSTVFDIDRRLIKYFSKVAMENKYNLNTVECDLFKFNKKEYKNKFDVFITDPPYALKGMLDFIDVSISVLKDGGAGYIAVPYHNNIAWTERLLFETDRLLLKRGCVITDIYKGFHRYQTADGLKSSMVRIVKGAGKKSINRDKYYSYKKSNINIPIISL
jgi:predicted methyltransferase